MRWAERSLAGARQRPGAGRAALFGIVAGRRVRQPCGASRRRICARWDFDGYALGGLSVGEAKA